MGKYRIINLNKEAKVFLGATLAPSEAVWVETNETFDEHSLYEDHGIAVKELEEFPEQDINGNKITPINA